MEPPFAIVVGASSGGVSALLELAAGLPADLPAAVGVVLHVGAQRSILPELLSQQAKMAARHAVDGEPLLRGTIYIAPPDRHLLFTPEGVRLSQGPRENHARPAIDPLFRSAALHWRDCAVGVVLTGALDDGTAGLASIKACGGTAIVQDPATAFDPSMPRSALANVAVDHCLPLAQIAPVLRERVERVAAIRHPVPDSLHREQAVFQGVEAVDNLKAVAQPSTFSCPDCGGSLWEISDGKPIRYRCHTGHAYSVGSLQSLQARETEKSLWSSIRSLQERETLLRRLAGVATATGDTQQAVAGIQAADRLRVQIQTLTELIKGETPGA